MDGWWAKSVSKSSVCSLRAAVFSLQSSLWLRPGSVLAFVSLSVIQSVKRTTLTQSTQLELSSLDSSPRFFSLRTCILLFSGISSAATIASIFLLLFLVSFNVSWTWRPQQIAALLNNIQDVKICGSSGRFGFARVWFFAMLQSVLPVRLPVSNRNRRYGWKQEEQRSLWSW